MMNERFEDAIDVSDVLVTLDALLPNGLASLSPALVRAFERDDYAEALRVANAEYGARGVADRDAALIYIVLLNGRGLVEESLPIVRKALAAHEQDLPLQLVQVDALLSAQREDDARALMDALLALELRDPRALAWLGDAFLDLDDPDAAIACYRGALDRGTTEADVPYRLGRLYIERGDAFDGASALEQAARIEQQDPDLWRLTAEAWAEADEIERMLSALERAARLDPDDPELRLQLGVTQHLAGKSVQGKRTLERLTREDPFMVEAWLQLAHVEFETSAPDEAMQHYRKVIELSGEHAEALRGVMASAMELGDVTMAQEYAARAITASPDDPENHYNAGLVALSLTREAAAISAFERAIELDPQEGRYWSSLAAAALWGDDPERPFAAITRALELDPEDAAGMLEFIEALLRRGQPARALELLRLHPFDGAPDWDLLGALLGLIAEGLLPTPAPSDEWLERFERGRQALGDGATEPFDWDFQELDRLIQRLPPAFRDDAQDLMDRLEGGF